MESLLKGDDTVQLRAADPDAAMLRQLGLLALTKRGLPAFYQALMLESDETLRVAAMAALLELGTINSEQVDLVLAHAHFGAVKRRAFSFFLSVFEYRLADQVATTPSEDMDWLLTERMKAEVALDYGKMAEFDRRLFLAHGTPDYLWSAEISAERHGGWRSALPMALASILARPVDPNGPMTLLHLLHVANQTDLLRKVCDSFNRSQIFPADTAVFEAAILNEEGKFKEALKVLQRLPAALANERLNLRKFRLRAEAFEGLGDYRQAHAAYQKRNDISRLSTKIDPKDFSRGVMRRSAYRIEAGTEPRTGNHVMMTGFPRSATTLLENVLSMHPEVETFEEPSAFSRMARALQRFAPPSGEVNAELAKDVRDRYYDELDRQSKKPTARLRIDKLPLLSADAVFLKKILPGQRFIFSIRHPHDVVLSCFRQSFVHNAAMENFNTIAEASELYHFTMSEWFKVHSLTDADVAYVRYEDLVENFRPTVGRVLDFLGLAWSDAVLGFDEAAGNRAAKTPSYKKVRSGLGIGVQSSRNKYAFLFDGKETAALKRWVKHFGYSD
jgi:tetratricopeptide (TPR) repeat protein